MTHTAGDFERFFIRYKAEGMPLGVSLQKYCSDNKVPYNLFLKWYKDTRHKVVPLEVAGLPASETIDAGCAELESGNEDSLLRQKGVRIMSGMKMSPDH